MVSNIPFGTLMSSVHFQPMEDAPMKEFLGRTVQLYTTSKCGMNCIHCASRSQQLPDMSMDVFREVIKNVERYGARRVELFANDPLLHPENIPQIQTLNDSNLDYALLTVGDSPNNKSVCEKFQRVVEIIHKERGGLVFSVDVTEESAAETLAKGCGDNGWAYAFKANTFWRYAPILWHAGLPIRTNTVVSRNNIGEAVSIMRRVIESGFAASCCYVQTYRPKFEELLRCGFTKSLEDDFRMYLCNSGLLKGAEINQVVAESRKIVVKGLLAGDGSPFNRFRGTDASEGEVSVEQLAQLRADLLKLKAEYPNRFLPGNEFIETLGGNGFGCLELLRQRQFPQLKIGSRGQLLFCCDMHDPITQGYSLGIMDGNEDSFLDAVRLNPHVWLCVWANPCDFSVNRVVYKASASR